MDRETDIPLENWALPGEPFRLVAVEINAADWTHWLTPEAQARAARFSDPRAWARAGASEWFKGWWLPRELGLERVEWKTGMHGKPRLARAAAEWGFNLTHAGTYVAAALAKGAAIGVDLEPLAAIAAELRRVPTRRASKGWCSIRTPQLIPSSPSALRTRSRRSHSYSRNWTYPINRYCLKPKLWHCRKTPPKSWELTGAGRNSAHPVPKERQQGILMALVLIHLHKPLHFRSSPLPAKLDCCTIWV